MAEKPDYTVGTISIASGDTALSGTGTQWISADIRPGDTLKVKNLDAVVLTVNSNTSITLSEAWTGGALSSSPYRIRYQPDGSRFTAIIQNLVSFLANSTVSALASLTGAAADKLPFFNAPATMGLVDFKAWARTFIGQADLAAARDALGVGKKGTPIVILGAGQSNAARESALTGSWNPPDNLKVWNGSDTLVPGTAWVTPNSANMNVFWRFAAEIALMNPDREVRLIKVGQGGRPISFWMTPPQAVDMYATTVSVVNAALLNLGASKLDMFLWWQGESDIDDQTTYEADFETVINRFRTNSWFNRNIPVGVFGISNSTVGGAATRGEMNNTLQRVVNRDPDNRMFFYSANAPASLWADTNHPTGDGYDYIGKMAFQNFWYGTHRANAGWIINPENGFASLRVGSFDIARVDNEGSKVGTTNPSPATNNVAGVAIRTAGFISAHAPNSGSLYLGRGNDGAVALFYNGGVAVGSISCTASPVGGFTATYNRTSDATLKNDNGELSFEEAKAILKLITIHNFQWKANGAADIGVFAQELYEIYPRAVTPGGWINKETNTISAEDDGNSDYMPWMVDYSMLMPVVARCVQGLLES